MNIQLIQSKIYEIRGYRVMIDFDLAEMYRVETRVLNQSVRRNIKRFPSDFMFQLTKEEFDILMSQIVISSENENLKSQLATSRWGGTRKLPYAFTEQGVAMLSGLLNSDIAIEMNIAIMRAFVYVRQVVLNSQPTDQVAELEKQMRELKQYIEESFADYNDINEDTRMQLELISRLLAELQAKKRIDEKPRNPIGYYKPN